VVGAQPDAWIADMAGELAEGVRNLAIASARSSIAATRAPPGAATIKNQLCVRERISGDMSPLIDVGAGE
jgi:hypothetical protein